MKHADTRKQRLVATLTVQAVVTLTCLGIAGWVAGTPAPTVARLATIAQHYSESNCRAAAQDMGLAAASAGDGALALSRASLPLREAALEAELLLQRCPGYDLAEACLGTQCLEGSEGARLRLAPRKPTGGED